MKYDLIARAAQLLRRGGRHRRWRRTVSGLAAVVVFVTSYMLILPALTLEQDTICGLEEHTHADACCEQRLVCTLEESEPVYEDQQVLTCTLSEGEGHAHTDGCYGLTCALEESAGHTHTEACYTAVSELTCTQAESEGHAHSDSCYGEDGSLICTLEESAGHTHADGCYTTVSQLTCTQAESAGHTHADGCYGLICGQEECAGHTHTDACYTTQQVQVSGHVHTEACYEQALICQIPEHTHDESCYPAQEEELVCELSQHTHGEGCYDADGNLTCTLPEHTHGEECYALVEIPEEDVPMTAFPEVIPGGYEEYSFDDGSGLVVTAYAPENAFGGQEVTLYAEVLAEDSEEYNQAAENLANAEDVPEYSGMVALDIRFEVDGAEVEPDAEAGPVYVDIRAMALLPEDVDESTLAVQHHTETTEGGIFGFFESHEIAVETVADNSDTTGTVTAAPAAVQTLDLTEEDSAPAAQDVEAQFAVESFSTFTITWDSGSRSKQVYITVEDADGSGIGDNEQISLSSNEQIIFASSNKIPVIDGYTYAMAYIQPTNGSTSSRTQIYGLKANYNQGWTTSYQAYNINGSLQWFNFSTTNYTIHLVYTKNSSLTTFRGVDLPAVHVNLYNYERYWNEGREYRGINYYSDNNERPFKFGSYGEYGSGINAWTGYDQGVYQGIVRDTLDSGKSPVLSSGNTSLSYLFDNTTSGVTKAVTDANFLFQVDSEGYYYYDSAENFAKLDNDGDFTLYTVPRAESSVAPPSEPQFLPFNDIVSDIKASLNTYDKAANNSNYGEVYTYYSLGEEVSADYLFGMTIEFDFNYLPGGKIGEDAMEFQFEGDDDVWVFIDDKLVLDLGGIHDSYSGTINFATGEVTVEKVYTTSGAQSSPEQKSLWERLDVDSWKNYSSHTLKFFYFERGQGGSNCSIRFNLPPIPNNSLNVVKDVTTDNADALTLLGDFAYQFQVVDEKGSLLVDKDDPYEIYEGAAKVGTGAVGDNGIFTLQDGQRAVFTKDKGGIAYTWLAANSQQEYYVRELLEDGYVAQYGDIQYTIAGTGGGTGTIEGSELTGDLEKFTGYQSAALKGNDGSGYVVFTNEISTQNLSKLYIEKELTPGTNNTDETFDMYVTINGVPLPEDTKYTIVGSDVTSTVERTGIIPLKAGETALLLNGDNNGIVAGTVYTVVEQGAEEYTITYSAAEHYKDAASGDTWKYSTVDLEPLPEGGVKGTVAHVASETWVTVTNSDYDFAANVVLHKFFLGANDGEERTFKFKVEAIEVEVDQATGVPSIAKILTSEVDYKASATITGERGGGDLYIFYDSEDVQAGSTLYYKVSEIDAAESDVIYDTDYYILGVEIYGSGENLNANSITVWKFTANGTYIEPGYGNQNWYPEEYRPEVFTRAAVRVLPFTNRKIGELSISKVVERTDGQAASGQDFRFGIVLKEGGTPLSGGPYNYTVYQKNGEIWTEVTGSAGTITFAETGISQVNDTSQNYISLDHNQKIVIEGLPAAAVAEITETTTDGYSTKWTGDTHPEGKEVVGAAVTTAQISTNPSVTCTNTTGAELPSTGGMGVVPYFTLGSLMTIGGGLLLIRRRWKGGHAAR